jgi:hypothetical protein
MSHKKNQLLYFTEQVSQNDPLPFYDILRKMEKPIPLYRVV